MSRAQDRHERQISTQANWVDRLPAGFLQAGVAGVVASLWSVADRSTMMLMVRFYDNWRNQQMEPAHALRMAQLWMRQTSDEEKERYLQVHLQNDAMPNAVSVSERHIGFPLDNEERTDTSFAHPYYWAAFTYTGV